MTMKDQKVKVRNLLIGKIYNGKFTTEHAASSYGQPVLVIGRKAVDKCWYEQIK